MLKEGRSAWMAVSDTCFIATTYQRTQPQGGELRGACQPGASERWLSSWPTFVDSVATFTRGSPRDCGRQGAEVKGSGVEIRCTQGELTAIPELGNLVIREKQMLLPPSTAMIIKSNRNKNRTGWGRSPGTAVLLEARGTIAWCCLLRHRALGNWF